MALFEVHQAYLKMRMKLKLVSFPCQISAKFVKQFIGHSETLIDCFHWGGAYIK
jgi:hypothetical protein